MKEDNIPIETTEDVLTMIGEMLTDITRHLPVGNFRYRLVQRLEAIKGTIERRDAK